MIRNISIVISFFLLSCEKLDPPENAIYTAYARQLYLFIEAYHVKEGEYPDNLNELKEIYLYSDDPIQKEHWDKYIHNKWEYQRPHPTKGNQIILSDYKYGVFIEVYFIDGVMEINRVNMGKVEQ